MHILFIHQNFYWQFVQIARHLAKGKKNMVRAICQQQAPKLKEVPCIVIGLPERLLKDFSQAV